MRISIIPPSLSDYGKLWLAKKLDLMHILAQEGGQDPPHSFDHVIALDGTARVHLLPTNNVTTFYEYASSVVLFCFASHIPSLTKCTRVDVMWDTYRSDSIKLPQERSRGKKEKRPFDG